MNSNSYDIVCFTLLQYDAYNENPGVEHRDTIITDNRSFVIFKEHYLKMIDDIRRFHFAHNFSKQELKQLWGFDELPILNLDWIGYCQIAYDVKESQLKKFNLSFVCTDTYRGFSQKTKEHFNKDPSGEFIRWKDKSQRYGTFSFSNNCLEFLLNEYHTEREWWKKEPHMKRLTEMKRRELANNCEIILQKRELHKKFLESDIFNPQTLIGRFEMNKPLIDDGMEDLVSPWVSPIFTKNKRTF